MNNRLIRLLCAKWDECRMKQSQNSNNKRNILKNDGGACNNDVDVMRRRIANMLMEVLLFFKTNTAYSCPVPSVLYPTVERWMGEQVLCLSKRYSSSLTEPNIRIIQEFLFLVQSEFLLGLLWLSSSCTHKPVLKNISSDFGVLQGTYLVLVLFAATVVIRSSHTISRISYRHASFLISLP